MGVHDHSTVLRVLTRNRHNCTLHTLVLNMNHIGDVGAAAIVQGLRCVHNLRALFAHFPLISIGLMVVCVTNTGVGVRRVTEGRIGWACIII
jgi:hypothetical protein